MVYKIILLGTLDDTWTSWLGDVSIHCAPGADGNAVTTILADLVDQSALFGLLDHLRDLNLGLVSVNPASADEK